jgi:hypothetical protein
MALPRMSTNLESSYKQKETSDTDSNKIIAIAGVKISCHTLCLKLFDALGMGEILGDIRFKQNRLEIL